MHKCNSGPFCLLLLNKYKQLHREVPETYIKYSLIKCLWNHSTLSVTCMEDTEIVVILTRTSKHLHSINYETISLLT